MIPSSDCSQVAAGTGAGSVWPAPGTPPCGLCGVSPHLPGPLQDGEDLPVAELSALLTWKSRFLRGSKQRLPGCPDASAQSPIKSVLQSSVGPAMTPGEVT